MPIDIGENRVVYSGITKYGEYRRRVVQSGLVLHLDAADPDSYPGTGSVWYDTSGNGHDYTMSGGHSWNSNGYFTCVNGGAFTGPASNLASWDFNDRCEHYIELWVEHTGYQSNQTFWWYGTTSPAEGRTIATHTGYGASGLSYYDVGGCCAVTQRISGNISGLIGSVSCLGYQTRYLGFPGRQIFKNLISVLDSGSNLGPNAVTWDDSTPSLLFSNWLGYAHIVRVYNRPLNPYEMAENFQATRERFGL